MPHSNMTKYMGGLLESPMHINKNLVGLRNTLEPKLKEAHVQVLLKNISKEFVKELDTLGQNPIS